MHAALHMVSLPLLHVQPAARHYPLWVLSPGSLTLPETGTAHVVMLLQLQEDGNMVLQEKTADNLLKLCGQTESEAEDHASEGGQLAAEDKSLQLATLTALSDVCSLDQVTVDSCDDSCDEGLSALVSLDALRCCDDCDVWVWQPVHHAHMSRADNRQCYAHLCCIKCNVVFLTVSNWAKLWAADIVASTICVHRPASVFP